MSEIKFAFVIIAIAALVPLTLIMRAFPLVRRALMIALGLMPFLTINTDVSLIALEQWVGHTYGVSLSIIDFIAVALFFTYASKKISFWFYIPFLLYIFTVFLSVLQAQSPLAATFYLFQLMRIFFVIVVVAKACSCDEQALTDILRGMAIGVVIQFPIQLWQLLVLKWHQASGTMDHQNTLGLMSHLVFFPFFALVLSGRPTMFVASVVLVTVAVVIVTVSRGTILSFMIGFMALLVLSMLRQPTTWKWLLVAISISGLVVLTPIVFMAFETRFAADPAALMEDQYDARAAMNKAAFLMLKDHPSGVGANHYSEVVTHGGYGIRAGIYSKHVGNTIHNAFLLVATETGYVGLLGFVVMLFCPVAVALWRGFHYPGRAGDLLIGTGIGLLMAYLQSAAEAIIIYTAPQYLLALSFGIVFGLAHRLTGVSRLDASPSRRQLAIGRPGTGWAA